MRAAVQRWAIERVLLAVAGRRDFLHALGVTRYGLAAIA